LHPYAYKLQALQAIPSDDRIVCNQCAVTIVEKMNENNEFLRKIMFSDDATLHVSSKVNIQNTHMLQWSTLGTALSYYVAWPAELLFDWTLFVC
jgi:hypothetical protein